LNEGENVATSDLRREENSDGIFRKRGRSRGRRQNQRAPKMIRYFLWIAFLMIFSPGVPPPASGSSWDQLSPQEQQILSPLKERWDQLPADRQERLRRGAERWQRMTPEQRKEAEERFKRWQELSPEQREVIRKRYREFRNLPPEEQEKIRRESRWFRELPPEKREMLRQKWQREEHREFRPKWPRK
jgi:hypothetical protein